MFNIFKTKEQKQYEERVCAFFNQVDRDIEDLRSNCDPYQTMQLKYYNQYSNIYHRTLDCANEVLKDNLNAVRFRVYKEKWKDLLKTQLIRIFRVSDSYSGGVRNDSNGLEDLKKAILQNEAEFKSRIKEAADYFGENFLEEKIWVCPDNKRACINAMNDPVTVEHVLNTSVTDWTKLEIISGRPKPYYHEMYNNNLKYILEKYV